MMARWWSAEVGLTDLRNNGCALIIQPGAIGDGILTIPLARLLREQAGMGRVDLMGHTEKLGPIQRRTRLERIISLESASLHRLFEDSATFDLADRDPLIELFGDYDLVVTFLADEQGHFERNLIYTTCMTRAAEVITVGLRPRADYPEHVAHYFMEQFVDQHQELELTIPQELMAGPLLWVEPDDIDEGLGLLARFDISGGQGVWALHPGSGGAGKCWPLDNFVGLAGRLIENGCQPFFLVGPVEKERWEESVLGRLEAVAPVVSDLSLDEVAGVLSCCGGYVGNDSGISHLAAGLGVPTVAVFGPSVGRHWRPLGQKVALCQGQSGAETVWPEVGEVLGRVEQWL